MENITEVQTFIEMLNAPNIKLFEIEFKSINRYEKKYEPMFLKKCAFILQTVILISRET